MRAARLASVLLVAAGCAHHRGAGSAAAPPLPLRLTMTAGETVRGRARLSLDVEMDAAKGDRGGGNHLALAFDAVDVEHVDTVAPDGSAQLSAALVDVRAAGSQAADPTQIEAFAIALGKVRVRLDRSPRGEVTRLEVDDVTPPLTEQTARALLTVLYHAHRGPLLPAADERSFTAQKALPEGSGFVGQITYTCSVTSWSGDRAQIGCDGHADGTGGNGASSRHMAVRSTAGYEVSGGALRTSNADDELTVELHVSGQQNLSTGVRQRVRVAWTRE
jgi:hypothetical protein